VEKVRRKFNYFFCPFERQKDQNLLSERSFHTLCQNTVNPGKGVVSSRLLGRDKTKHTALLADAFAGFSCVLSFMPCLARRSDLPAHCFVKRFY
jgi:hypothetical protein